MNFFQIFKKYYTRILLISVLILMMFASVTNFDKTYNKTLESSKQISSVKELMIKVASFPVIKNGKLSFDGIVKQKDIPESKFSISVKDSEIKDIYPGDTLIIKDFALFSPEKLGNEGGFDSAMYFKSCDKYGTIYSETAKCIHKTKNIIFQSLTRIRQNVINNTDRFFKPRYAGLVKALITGERYGIDDSTENSLKVSGVYHIVAISGLHLNIFIMIIAKFMSSLKIKRRKKALISGAICTAAAMFVLVFTGFGLSVVRAFVMLVISLGSSVFSRKYSGKNSLMLSAAIIVIIAPESIYSTGFILSVLSTLAVIISAEISGEINKKENLPGIFKGNIASVFITSAMCTIFTLPVMMGTFYFIPSYCALANLVILPAVSPALLLSVVFCVFSSIGLNFIAKILSYCITTLAHYISESALIISSLPFSKINLYPLYTAEFIILFAITFVCIYFTLRKMRKCLLASGIIFVLAACAILMYNGLEKDAKLIFADVGQGDCTIMRLPDGQAVMIDCGSSDNEDYIGSDIRNTLIKNNIPKLSAVFVSHYHSDHISEIIKLADEGYIKNIFIPSLYNVRSEETQTNRHEIICASVKGGAKIHEVRKGAKIEPYKDCVFEVLLPGTDMFMDDNDMSSVIKFTYGDVIALFTGDIEKDATEKLLEKDIDCDILKVPHHGGKNELVKQLAEKTSPEYALIGCGENNVYKHPDKETENTLTECGAKVYRTDADGSITLVFDRTKIKQITKMR